MDVRVSLLCGLVAVCSAFHLPASAPAFPKPHALISSNERCSRPRGSLSIRMNFFGDMVEKTLLKLVEVGIVSCRDSLMACDLARN